MPETAPASSKGMRNMQTVKRVKGTVVLTVVVLLCIELAGAVSGILFFLQSLRPKCRRR